jgi:hypothetical protein
MTLKISETATQLQCWQGLLSKCCANYSAKGIESELSIEDAIKFLGELLVGNGIREG